MIDDWDVMKNPHGELEKDEELRRLTTELYGSKVATRKYKLRIAFSESDKDLMFTTCHYL